MDDPIGNVNKSWDELFRIAATPEFSACMDDWNRRLILAHEGFIRAWGEWANRYGPVMAEALNQLRVALLTPELRAVLEKRPEFQSFYQQDNDPKEAARKRSRDDLAKKRRDFRQRKGKL